MNTNIEHVRYVKITVGESNCTVDEEVWDQAVAVLDKIAEYTGCVDVNKVVAIKLLHNHVDCGLREAKLMAEAYFERCCSQGSASDRTV